MSTFRCCDQTVCVMYMYAPRWSQ